MSADDRTGELGARTGELGARTGELDDQTGELDDRTDGQNARTDGLDARVLVVMGVSGSGKSTVAAMVAEQLGWDFAEGDAMHPQSNVDKMHAGTPLTDADRWPWLDVVAAWIREHLAAGRPGVVTCSALKRSYRDVLRAEGVVFVHVAGSGALIADRMSQRSGHFMPTSLLASQLALLEPPEADEAHLTIAADRTPADESAEVIERLGLAPTVR